MSTIKTETLSTPSNATVPVDTVVNGTAKAWVNFNGTGTVAIRKAFNVSSITDNGSGDYSVNFTTAMPDANYTVCGSAGYGAGGSGRYMSAPTTNGFTADFLTTSVRVNSVYDYNAPQDCEVVNVAIFS